MGRDEMLPAFHTREVKEFWVHPDTARELHERGWVRLAESLEQALYSCKTVETHPHGVLMEMYRLD